MTSVAALTPTSTIASDAARLAEASGVALELDAAALPLADGVAEVASALGMEAAELAATAGEDYELCFCVPPERREAADGAAPVTWIGRALDGPPGLAWRGAASAARWRGYEH